MGYQLQVFGIYVDLYCVVVIAVSEVKMSRQTTLSRLGFKKAFHTEIVLWKVQFFFRFVGWCCCSEKGIILYG